MSYNKSAKEATMRYLNKQKQIRFWVSPETYERFEAIAKASGYASMRQFYLDAIEEKIQKTIEKS